MITVEDGKWIGSDGKRIKTNSELYVEAVEKDNQRVGREWDALGPVLGSQYEAVQLAILQGNRSAKLAKKYGCVH